MSDSFKNGWPGGRRGDNGPEWSGAAAWDAINQLRGQFERRVGMRMGRGDVRAAVLTLLAEKPMHGYQIIQEIGERSGGGWKPSPGSVYPTLQLLADEGLIAAKETNGRKTYSLTDDGKAAADAASAASAPWEARDGRGGIKTGALPKAGIDLAHATAQVARTGSPKQVDDAVEVLNDARRKLYSILAQE
jgi:DNA-binding PadR family transcriptional regulator